MIKCVLFDLDGTLLSTLDTITYHLDSVISERSLGGVTVEDTRQFIGNGARKLVTRALAKNGVYDDATVSMVLEEYNRAYDADPLPHTAPYDGICELVDELYSRGFVLGVVTNKPHPTAQKLVDSFFPGKFAFVRGGGDGVILKPDPTESLKLISRLNIDASECAFVGDTDVDIFTAKNMCASLSLGVAWGFRSREELVSAGADAVVERASEILDLIREVV